VLEEIADAGSEAARVALRVLNRHWKDERTRRVLEIMATSVA
jgi:hypothetical protein